MVPQVYYPLIAIDWHRNETHKEWPGANWEDAALKLAKRYGCAEVLSNAPGQKRGGNGAGMYNRKPLYKAPAPPPALINGSHDLPALPTLTDLLSPRSQMPAPGLSLIQAPALIKMLRSQGFIFELKYVDGKRKLLMDKQITCSVTNSEFGKARDIVRERKGEFIEALEAEAGESPSRTSEPSEPDDPLKGKKLQDIILSMLPQMPTPFNVDDLAERLRVAGYTELSTQRTRLLSSIHGAKKSGHLEQAGYAKYTVTEASRHRRPPTEQPKEDAVITAQSEPVVEPPPEPQDAPLSMEAYVPPRQVIEVPAPEESLPATAVVEPEPPVPALQLQAPLMGIVLDLASQAASSHDDTAALAEKLTAAGQQFETTMLEAVEALTAAINAVADQLNHRAAARKTLLKSLTAQIE